MSGNKTLRLLGRVIQSCSEVFRIWLLVFRLVSQLQWQEPGSIMIRMSDFTERMQFKTYNVTVAMLAPSTSWNLLECLHKEWLFFSEKCFESCWEWVVSLKLLT